MSLRRAAERCLRNQRANVQSNAFITRPSDESVLLRSAAEADARHQSGRSKSPLDGQLIAIKDNICTKYLPTTCASAILKNYVSPFEATVVRRLQDAGALLAGKTNLDEFGMGSHSIYSAFGAVKNISQNKNKPGRSAGGSSGGSALAVATGQCYAALGTDTGGSVRLPAAYTGTVGFKPSYGLVSRWGVVAYANSLDTVGVLASNIQSAKEIFDVINAYDPRDPTSLSEPTRTRITEQVSGKQKNDALRIGIPLEYNIHELDPIIRRTWQRSIEFFHRQGHSIIPIHLPTIKHALSAYYILAPSEASSNLAKYDGIRYGTRADGPDDTEGGVLYARTRGENFGEEVQARILLGTFSLSAAAIDNYFIQAQKIRRMVQNEFDSVFALTNPLLGNTSTESTTTARQQLKMKDGDKTGVDVLLCPTAPSLPPTLESLYHKDRSPLDAYTNDVLTVPASLAGLPAVSVPLGLEDVDREDDPDVITVGMQIIGQFGDDARVLAVGRMLEEGLSPGRPTDHL